MKRCLVALACAAATFPATAVGGYTPTPTPRVSTPPPRISTPAPRISTPPVTPRTATPQSVTPKTYSAPPKSLAGSGSGGSYKPPRNPPAPPAPGNRPAGVPRSAYYDTHSPTYWANPASPYYYVFLAEYGHPHEDDGDDTPWWAVVAIIGAFIAVCGAIWWLDR